MLRFRVVCICYWSVGVLYSKSYHSVISMVLFKRVVIPHVTGMVCPGSSPHPTDSPWQEKRLFPLHTVLNISFLPHIWHSGFFLHFQIDLHSGERRQNCRSMCLIADRKNNFILNNPRKDHAESTEVEEVSPDPRGLIPLLSFHPDLLKLYWLLSCLDIEIAWWDLRLSVLIVNVGTFAAENVKCQFSWCFGAQITLS